MRFQLELIFRDRVGIVADISALIADHGLNIFSITTPGDIGFSDIIGRHPTILAAITFD